MMVQSGPLEFSSTYLRLRADASVEPLPVDNTFWQRIMSGQLGDFHHEFLIAGSTFDRDWATWEMHPNGDEIVCLLFGAVTFLLEEALGTKEIELKDSGAYVVIPKGTWHTARTPGQCRMLFITPGEGTQHRPAK
jgi:mannose-6-phosphate isomerase-like protein (cupin superfamily)